MSFKDKAARMVSESKLRVYETNPELEALFADKDFAIADGFIPIMPRHMTADNWRHLFWHQPTLVVIKGRRYPDLCSICVDALKCVRKDAAFECKVTSKRLMLEELP
jgi:hypothetical protein